VYAAVRYPVNAANGQLLTAGQDYVGEGLAVKVLGGLGVPLDEQNMQAGEHHCVVSAIALMSPMSENLTNGGKSVMTCCGFTHALNGIFSAIIT
jgi:hypothetical protein